MSLRLKISLLSALISGGILLGFGTASWYVMYRERLAAVDREIRTLAARHPGWLANRPSYERLTSMLEFTFGEQRKDRVILLIRDRAGTVLYQSPHWPGDLKTGELHLDLRDDPSAAEDTALAGESPRGQRTGPPWGPGFGGGPGRGHGYGWGPGAKAAFTKIPKFFTAKAGGSWWRFGVMGDAETTLALGVNYAEVQGELQHLRGAFLLVLPLALLLAAAGGWIVGSRALRPLQMIADTAERVTARGLDQRIPAAAAEGEVGRVVRVLNGMMDRLEKSFHQATRFTADASHELKTPLTIMQGELEQALQVAPVGSQEQQVFNNLLEETQRLKNITRNLLLLAQADSGQLKLSRQPVDLSALLQNVLEDARILAGALDLSFDLKLPQDLQVHGDPLLLSTALLNLIGNAVKYNEPHGRVAVQAERGDRRMTLLIGNAGPGIPERDHPRLFERFFRARPIHGEPSDGVGLGLSLAREIIRAHAGELDLQESRPGWTCFRVELPAGPTGE
jgi:two-component system, OmpR family, heavy metal sensor histidine kinase CusS